MTAYTGTITREGRAGERGMQFIALGKYALTGALVNADTITWSNLLPDPNRFKVIGFRFWSPELDTDATPTATIIVGDGTDTDAYLTTSNVGLPAQAPANGYQINLSGNGAAIGAAAGTAVSRNVVLTVNGVVATGATTGTLWVEFVCEAI